MKHIAIIGSGISGLAAAYLLQSKYRITLYEANDYLGGHTASVDVQVASGRYTVDTGFIVFNERTYPNFLRLLDRIGISKQATEMSFSVSNPRNGLEYNGHNLSTMFAQRRNLFKPSFYRFIGEILRFNRLAKQTALQGSLAADMNIGDFLSQHHFSEEFSENYILPMIAAIWSSSVADAGDFPLLFFLNFFVNHGLFEVANRPQWYVIPGGSRSYIPALTARLDDIRLNTAVTSVSRNQGRVQITTERGTETVDEVIFACHSDQALQILGANATHAEQQILGNMHYRDNDVILHTDSEVLPRAKRAWASWNYALNGNIDAPPSVTYNMNILQGLSAPETFCVSLNSRQAIEPSRILGRYRYAHPVINAAMLQSQQRRGEICGHHQTHFCGAYWYNGFHEDGLRSALDVCQRFGVAL